MAYRKAVICDDNWALARILQHLLLAEGFSAVAASDGVEGLAAVRTEKPELLILDLQMPGKDGFAVLEELQRHANGPCVIVLSNLENHDVHQKAIALGARKVMMKPCAAADFARAVQEVSASEALQ